METHPQRVWAHGRPRPQADPGATAAAGPLAATVADAADMVRSGSRVAVSGFHFVRAPIALLEALAQRAPLALTYVAWGGGLPLELLLEQGNVRRAVVTFSSLDIFGLAPRFRAAVESGELELEEWTALGMIEGLRAAGRNLGWSVLQAPVGSDLFPGTARPAPQVDGGRDAFPMAVVPPIEVDTLLLHAQRADEAGNVEIAGAKGFDLSLVFAARQVLVTVEERVATGALGARGAFVLPRTFVTAIAEVPFGASPTSCLPYYPADYRALQRYAGGGGDSSLAPDGARRRQLAAIATQPPEQVVEALTSAADAGSESYTVDELMVCCLARSMSDASICSVGSVSPLAGAAYRLAKLLWAPDLLLLSFNGGLVDVAPHPLSIVTAEQLDVASAVTHAGGDETYQWYYQPGLVTHEIVSAAQIDRRGATNNLHIDLPDGRRLRLPGQGGMADVANLHASLLLYLPRHDRRTMVETVHAVSAVRAVDDPVQRQRYRLADGTTRVTTSLGQFAYDRHAGELVLTHVHPGVAVEAVRANTGWDLRVADDLAETQPPSALELETLRTRVDPLGIRRLELVASRDRQALIDELLTIEEDALAGTTVRGSHG